MPRIRPEELTSRVAQIFRAVGVEANDAILVSQHLVEANLAGHDSHGVLRVSQYVQAIKSGEVRLDTTMVIEADSIGSAVIDARGCLGQVAAHRGMRLAMEKARASAAGAVTVRNCYHSGRIGSYSALAASEDMVGIVMVNAGGGGQSVAPFGGTAPRLATNPISIAAPSEGPFPIVLDIATSVAPEGKIRVLSQQNKKTPEGWMIDAAGNPITDPNEYYATPPGAILPMGGEVGHKGFGLALMIDILAGALSGAGCCSSSPAEPRDGMLMLALDITKFGTAEAFRQHVAGLVEHVKATPTAPGFDEIYVPGELEFRAEQRRRREGILVDDATWSDIETIAESLGLAAVKIHSDNGHPIKPKTRRGSGAPSETV